MRKYNLQQYIHTRHQGVGAYWNQKHGGWDVKIKDLNSGKEFDDHCDILINAGGILNNWRWPAIPGLHDFKGPLLHTANWNDDIDLRGKHVGLIGNGYVFIAIAPVDVGSILTSPVLPEFKFFPRFSHT